MRRYFIYYDDAIKMISTAEKLANEIMDVVDSYANLDHLWEPSFDNPEITQYEELRNVIRWMIDEELDSFIDMYMSSYIFFGYSYMSLCGE